MSAGSVELALIKQAKKQGRDLSRPTAYEIGKRIKKVLPGSFSSS